MKRDPKALTWVESGRRYVAEVGPLLISVRSKGSKARGDRMWMVDEVFGLHHLGSRWHDYLDDAIAEAERVAFREAAQFVAAVRPHLRRVTTREDSDGR